MRVEETNRAVTSLTHFVASISGAKATWEPGSELDRVFDKFSGDIVQAVQALKESGPDTTPGLLASLQSLLTSFTVCAEYCSAAAEPPGKYPFTRAERQVRDVLGFLYPATAAPPPSSHAPVHVDLSKREVEVQTFQVGPYRWPRLLNGLWQLSSPAWGSGSAESQEAALAHLVESGLSAADMADHYVGKAQGRPPRRAANQSFRRRAMPSSSTGTSEAGSPPRSGGRSTPRRSGAYLVP